MKALKIQSLKGNFNCFYEQKISKKRKRKKKLTSAVELDGALQLSDGGRIAFLDGLMELL